MPMVRRRRKPFAKTFPEIACHVKAECYVKHPWVGRSKICSGYLGHMTKMAAVPIHVIVKP